jgi:hypothetical protein
VKDHQTETIEQLRAILKETKEKLEYRTQLLAQLVPHLEAWSNDTDVGTTYNFHSSNYVCTEIIERYGSFIERFKDEYGKENQLQQHKDSKL